MNYLTLSFLEYLHKHLAYGYKMVNSYFGFGV